MDGTFDVGAHQIILESPRRLSDESQWVEHIPFAMLLVELARPSLLVELGTHHGDSYCSFCQAVQHLDVPARCFAVDTWRGDEQTGWYGQSVLENLRAHHDPAYGSFSSLIQGTFDDAAGQFEDGSIDVLHIDGYHTYEAVRHDFETWLPKLSPRGVVLFHDTNVHEGDFGVWRFWAEVTRTYPHIEFAHGHGLGVLSVGSDEPPALRQFRAAFDTQPWVARLFFDLGQRLSAQSGLAFTKRVLGGTVADQDALIQQQRAAMERQDEALTSQQAALTAQEKGLADKDALIEQQRAAMKRQNDGLVSQQEALVAHREQIAALEARGSKLAATEGELREALAGRDAELAHTRAELEQMGGQTRRLQAEIDGLRQSLGYKVVARTIRQVDRVAPWSTRRRQLVIGTSGAIKVLASEGVGGMARRLPRVQEWWPQIWNVAIAPDPVVAVQADGRELTLDEEYQLWLGHHAPSPEALQAERLAARRLAYRPKISIVIPVHNTNPTWLRAAVASVRTQTYPNWELCLVDDGSTNPQTRAAFRSLKLLRGVKTTRLKAGQGIAGATNRGLALATGEFVGFLDHDDELKAGALFQVVSLLNAQRDLDFIYSDEDKREPDGRLVDVFFKPDWSPEMLLAMNYVTHFSVYRKSVLDRVGGLRAGFDGSQDHDLALRVTEQTDRIAHIPLPLYTWRKVPGSTAGANDAKPYAKTAATKALQDAMRRRGAEAEVLPGLWAGSYRVRHRILGHPKVAIIIPTRDRVELLRTAIDSIESLSTYPNYEVLVVDNGSREAETLDYLATLKGRVIPYPQQFHYAAMMNLAALQARAEFLVFLNNDTEVISPGWIEAMLEYAQQPAIAAVGARLRYPDGTIQHEGVVMGLAGTANNVDHRGYFGQGAVIANVSAVTAACMMTRAEVYEELGGMEENLAVAFNDVDYCLRAREKGYRVVYTPYAELYHYESATRGSLHPPADEQFFRDRWGTPGEYVDRYYNPNLDPVRAYRIRTTP